MLYKNIIILRYKEPNKSIFYEKYVIKTKSNRWPTSKTTFNPTAQIVTAKVFGKRDRIKMRSPKNVFSKLNSDFFKLLDSGRP